MGDMADYVNEVIYKPDDGTGLYNHNHNHVI